MYPVIHVGHYTFYTFGLMIGLGIALTYVAVQSYFRRHDLEVNLPLLYTVALVAGFIGAKLDYAFFYEHAGVHVLFREPLLLLARGGYTYFGGMVAGIAAAAIYVKANRLPFLRMFDGLFCLALVYGAGRIGCFMSGDGDYGVPTAMPWGMSFPNGIVPTTAHVHPTMLYLSVWEFAIFAILWHFSNPRRQPALRPGTLLGCYLIASGAGRFLVEFLSRNPSIAFGLKEAQLVSLAMMTVGLCVLVRLLLTRPQTRTLFVVPRASSKPPDKLAMG